MSGLFMQPLHILHEYLVTLDIKNRFKLFRPTSDSCKTQDMGFTTFRILFHTLPTSKLHTLQSQTFSIPPSFHFIRNCSRSTQTTLILRTLQKLFLIPLNLPIIQTSTPICTIKTHIHSCTT